MNLKKSLDVLNEKKIMENLVKCSKCRLSLICEELDTHFCFSGKLKDVIIDSSRPFSFLIFDGQNWHKCPNPNNNRRVTRRNTNREGNSTILWVLLH